jgi:two-component system sensor histidine kinase/response regulator
MLGSAMEGGEAPTKILAVDDTPANLLALSSILEPLEAELVVADSGAEALDLAASHQFAMILLDVMMPAMDGFETLAKLRTIPSAEETPVVLLTAYELDTRSIERVRGMGTVDYILKPIQPILLRSKVAALVSLFRRGEEIRHRDAALAAKDRDIAMLAHDLQNPLTTIKASSELLLRSDCDDLSRNAANRIARVAGRMSDMIRSLTDYARAGRGAIPIARTPMDLGGLCGEIIADLRLSHPDRPLELRCVGALGGEWDDDRLYQAVSNLISNAIKYGEGTVAVRVEDAGSDVEITVHNDGPVIAAELLPVIFKPFERGKQDRTGLGLGLYIVEEIVKAHHGEISVTSWPASGTTFAVQLPRNEYRGKPRTGPSVSRG